MPSASPSSGDTTTPPTIPRTARHRNLWALAVLCGAVLCLAAAPARGQPTNPPCRSGIRWLFRPAEICGEEVLSGLTSQGIASISALAFGPDGALYFARPAAHAIMRMQPDGEGFFRAPEVFTADLPEPPNGLTYDAVEDAWYVSADTTIVRLKDGAQQVLVRGLPGGAGGWLGNIRIGPDRRLYVAKGAGCNACVESDPRRAALLSFALDGSEMRIEARGLRDSYDFDWNPTDGALYVVDNERAPLPAELNAFTGQPGADFGWPHCDARGEPLPAVPGASAERCAETIPPVLTFDPASHPMGVAFYDGEAFPAYQGGLLVALAGSWNATTIAGYELVLVRFAPDGRPDGVERLLPDTTRSTSDATLLRTSFYPYRLTGIAISAEGWIYVGVAQGRIYRFRPMPS